MSFVPNPKTSRSAAIIGATALAAASDLVNTSSATNLYWLSVTSPCWYAQGIPLTTFTVASQAQGQLTMTAHPLQTGDGPVQASTSGALPTGLAVLTSYWVIRVDANTIQLATSRANALAGTFIVLSSNGSGTNQLQVVASVGGQSCALVQPNQPALVDGVLGAQLSVIQDPAGTTGSPPGNIAEANIPATAGALTVFTGPGMLIEALVTATGAANLTFQDAAGNVIAEVLSTATVGQVIQFNAPFGTSLVANKSATTPVVTIGYSTVPVARASVTQLYWVR